MTAKKKKKQASQQARRKLPQPTFDKHLGVVSLASPAVRAGKSRVKRES